MKPFLKWAGNKYRILSKVKAVLPAGKRLIEPFVGAGAVFLNTEFSEYLLTDTNTDLIELYIWLQKDGPPFIEYCKQYFTAENNSSENFYKLRTLFNTTQDKYLKSALFVYLNKHCYNGLCRYNSKGIFNTPFGKYKKPYFPAAEMLFFHQKSQQAVIRQADFSETILAAQIGDVVYCDPPYAPISKTANFSSYSAAQFGLQQQQKLVTLAETVSKRGIPVIISNHNTHFTQEIYRRAMIHPFEVQRYISCKGGTRIKVSEILAVYGL